MTSPGPGHNHPPDDDADDAWQESVARRTILYIAPENRFGGFVFCCLGCDGLEMGRADQITCSPACRVRWHRNPNREIFKSRVKAEADVDVVHIVHARAVLKLEERGYLMAEEHQHGRDIYRTAPNGRRLGSSAVGAQGVFRLRGRLLPQSEGAGYLRAVCGICGISACLYPRLRPLQFNIYR
jgi:hypothetical protein